MSGRDEREPHVGHGEARSASTSTCRAVWPRQWKSTRCGSVQAQACSLPVCHTSCTQCVRHRRKSKGVCVCVQGRVCVCQCVCQSFESRQTGSDEVW